MPIEAVEGSDAPPPIVEQVAASLGPDYVWISAIGRGITIIGNGSEDAGNCRRDVRLFWVAVAGTTEADMSFGLTATGG